MDVHQRIRKNDVWPNLQTLYPLMFAIYLSSSVYLSNIRKKTQAKSRGRIDICSGTGCGLRVRGLDL